MKNQLNTHGRRSNKTYAGRVRERDGIEEGRRGGGRRGGRKGKERGEGGRGKRG